MLFIVSLDANRTGKSSPADPPATSAKKSVDTVPVREHISRSTSRFIERATGPPAARSGIVKIALISPKGPLYRHRGGIFKRPLRYAPLTLTTLASLVPAELNARITLMDEGIEDVDPDLDADLIGLTVITGTAPRAYELARHFRSRGIAVVMGGPHATLVPDDAQPHADSVVVGYAEDTWPELLRDVGDARLRPRYTQQAGLSLARRPFPRRDLLPARRFLTTNVFEATRACIHNCEFCVVPSAWGRRPYQKPVGDVIADIRQHGARKLIFVDLNLIADRDYAMELFEALVPLRVEWYGLSTVLIAEDAALLAAAARSGCRGLLIGFESLVGENLRGVSKVFNRPSHYARVVERLHAHRVAVYGCFVFGLDHDTTDVFLQTAEFAVDSGIDLPRFAISTPFPGTPLHDRLEREGRILTRNWELYDGQHVVFQPSRMSVAELQAGTERAWRTVYSVRSILRRLRASPASLGVAVAANLAYRHYAHHLHRFYNCDWILESRAVPAPVAS